MNKTLTIRLGPEQRNKLARVARRHGKTISQLVRDLLDKGLAEHRLGDKTKHLRGRLKLSQTRQDSWRREIKDRNWR